MFDAPQNGKRVDAALPELELMPVAQTLGNNWPVSPFGHPITFLRGYVVATSGIQSKRALRSVP
ncbi:MAG: hypothetical protein WB760_21925 [Xanthobacteraceae bacterium]